MPPHAFWFVCSDDVGHKALDDVYQSMIKNSGVLARLLLPQSVKPSPRSERACVSIPSGGTCRAAALTGGIHPTIDIAVVKTPAFFSK
jgi:hypothetical protein